MFLLIFSFIKRYIGVKSIFNGILKSDPQTGINLKPNTSEAAYTTVLCCTPAQADVTPLSLILL